MDKKFRKQIEQQLALTITYFLKKTDAKIAEAMEKSVSSAAKDLAKKFVKKKEALEELKAKKLKSATTAPTATSTPASTTVAAKKATAPAKKKSAKKAVKKSAKKAAKVVKKAKAVKK
ncbi:MAG TPA: hypothetical protein PLG57_09485 [Bacteroidia bacterium]|jgi:hypothetical protein|nr:hypothetical protein [Bacteroidia bacterium]HQF29094.1 hypothetical protein [Bacteroidia bacterium]HQK97554.1 hypothetical protein [Bacteroidia bacterium]